MIRTKIKRINTFLGILSASLLAFMFITASPVRATDPAECDDNAIVRCGTFSKEALRASYKGDVEKVYSHFGITQGMVNGSSATIKEGYVTKSGNVIVENETIATNAVTVGRQNIDGSTSILIGGKTYYQRTPAISFVRDRIEAYVMVDQNGEFLGAVLKSCGNPVKATPKTTPKAECTNLTINKISRTKYTFTATATTSGGAKIQSYVFLISGPNSNQTLVNDTASTSITTGQINLPQAGQYTVAVTVKTTAGDRTNTKCSKQFTVYEEMIKTIKVCDQATGKIIEIDEKNADKYLPENDDACKPKGTPTIIQKVPSTGPGEIISGLMGAGSLTAVSYYFRASHNKLQKAIWKK